MTHALATDILSLGKLLRKVYDFYFTDFGKSCYAFSPGGAHKINASLGSDDLLRLEHAVREGTDSVPLRRLPDMPVNALRRSVDAVTACFLHEVFLHASSEKIHRTLGATTGYKQCRMPKHHCSVCVQARARSFGLRNTAPAVMMAQHLSVFDDPEGTDDDSDDEGVHQDTEYVAAVAGRELGVQHVPRFDLSALRPFEAMFVDNKDYPCAVRGGAKTALVFIDYFTRCKFKVDVSTKKNNGRAFLQIVVKNGIHKLSYPCRVYSDGCGSMVHVKEAAVKVGIDHA